MFHLLFLSRSHSFLMFLLFFHIFSCLLTLLTSFFILIHVSSAGNFLKVVMCLHTLCDHLLALMSCACLCLPNVFIFTPFSSFSASSSSTLVSSVTAVSPVCLGTVGFNCSALCLWKPFCDFNCVSESPVCHQPDSFRAGTADVGMRLDVLTKSRRFPVEVCWFYPPIIVAKHSQLLRLITSSFQEETVVVFSWLS